MEPVPARLNVVVMGVSNLPVMRDFYQRLGWRPRPTDGPFASFKLEGASLVLFPADQLAGAVGRSLCDCGNFSGTTPAMILGSDAEVEAVLEAVRAAQGTVISGPTDRPWGSRTAYVEDPEGNVWELAVIPSVSKGS